MKKLLISLPLLFLATISYAECYKVEGVIVTFKEHYDEKKNFSYQEEAGRQYYNECIEASDRSSAKSKAMRECQSMCYSADTNYQKITDRNGNTIGYTRLVRKTEITSCISNAGCCR